jgi:hypothetical protein
MIFGDAIWKACAMIVDDEILNTRPDLVDSTKALSFRRDNPPGTWSRVRCSLMPDDRIRYRVDHMTGSTGPENLRSEPIHPRWFYGKASVKVHK